MFNIKEILKAWEISFHPTKEQTKLAELRLEVCEKCESQNVFLGISYCKECGCPITKKVYTNLYNPCPLRKWEEIDKGRIQMKNEKTLL